jgi:Bacterial RNA polymerase, alpha chain C terminal domain
LARYTIIINPENSNEPSTTLIVNYDAAQGAELIEYSVTPVAGRYTAPPVLDAVIASFRQQAIELRSGAPRHTADLGLSSRASNALWKAGIRRTADLVSLTRHQLLEIHGLGRGGANEIVAALKRYKISLAAPASAEIDGAFGTVGGDVEWSSAPPGVPYPRSRQRFKPYRRMPDDFVETSTELNEEPGRIASHYNVPTYTVHNWRRSVRRRQGTSKS